MTINFTQIVATLFSAKLLEIILAALTLFGGNVEPATTPAPISVQALDAKPTPSTIEPAATLDYQAYANVYDGVTVEPSSYRLTCDVSAIGYGEIVTELQAVTIDGGPVRLSVDGYHEDSLYTTGTVKVAYYHCY